MDAEDNYVFPGFIDTHTHLELPKRLGFSKDTNDFETETMAALAGGTTTIFDFVLPEKNESLIDALNRKVKYYEGTANCKYQFHVVLTEVKDNLYEQLKQLKRKGIKGIKIYTTYDKRLTNEEIIKVMNYCSKLDLVVLVHCEDNAIIEYCKNKHNYNFKRPAKAEENAVYTIANYALITKCITYFCNISCSKSVEIIKRIKQKGGKVYLETCPHYLILNSSKYLKSSLKEGTKFLVSPPLREEKDNKALIEACLDGTVDLISTDHCAYLFEEHKKKYYYDISKAAEGIPGIQLRPSLIYTILVKERGFSVENFVKLLSYNPSRIFSVYDRGYIREGATADIVIWEDKKFKVNIEDLHEGTDYSPYEGMELVGKAKYVL
ncbi:amidohydrolase family protein [Clostridium ganghwense]|uniref:Amidohydrolase family protein n=1 Tax=Clostridium ganghwense TaxID=312089 RepID=A0ABT4CPA4_9CLOT|nr:amidohydrolase family protein [Clostridium ganghwense]